MTHQHTFLASSLILVSAFGCGSGGDDVGAAVGGGSSTGGQSLGGNGVGGHGAGVGGLGTGSGGSSTGGSVGSGSGGVGASSGGAAAASGGTASGGSLVGSGGTASGGALLGSGGAETASGGGGSASCAFTVGKNEVSSKMATVGVVEWSVVGGAPTSAKLVYTLKDAPSTMLNKGGEAPVDLKKTNYRTLLLGLKQSKDYTFHIEAITGSGTCVSDEFSLPKTGALAGAPTVSVNVAAADKRKAGFIITSTGLGGGGVGGGGASSAYIIDADGEIVWYSAAPASASRALMDYEGENMWMLALNVQNGSGEMRYVSMDGQTSKNNVEGLAKAHHDFTVMPGGKVAAMVWRGTGMDPESDLVIRSPDGTLATPFKIGSNLYASSSFHCNAIHYLPVDDSFTISERNPNLYVKVSSSGQVQWQIGGSCTNAPAGSKCSPQSWKVNHGHDLLDDGSFVLFNNGTSGNAHIFEFDVADTGSAFTATLVKDYTGTVASNVLGDVQRLPGGNTLISYSTSTKIIEVDSSFGIVQTFSGGGGYSSWRPTLYGPPTRL